MILPFSLVLIIGIPISLIDLKTLHISNRILIPGIIISFLFHLGTSAYSSSFLFSGTGTAALMTSIYLISGKKMGTGDIKYSFFLGTLIVLSQFSIAIFPKLNFSDNRA